MPKFSVGTLAIVVAFVAVWLSTLSGYPASTDVRRSVVLVVILAPAIAAIHFRGRQRSFWATFFVVVILLDNSPLRRWVPYIQPSFDWAGDVATRLAVQIAKPDAEIQSRVHSSIYWSLRMEWTIAVATVLGMIAVRIYDASHPISDRQT